VTVKVNISLLQAVEKRERDPFQPAEVKIVNVSSWVA